MTGIVTDMQWHNCLVCVEPFQGRADALTCSAKCRQKWSRGLRGNDAAEQRMITAHHEAGHAVASVICNGTLYKIDIEGDDGFVAGRTYETSPEVWAPYVIYGGVWAEARLRCRSTHPQFPRIVKAVFSDQSGHHSSDGPRFRAAKRATGRKQEPLWDTELETFWPAMQRVAALLLAGVAGVETLVPGIVETVR